MNKQRIDAYLDALNHERSLLPSEQRALLDAVEGLKAQVAQAAAHADSFRKHIELVQDSARRGWDKVREAEARYAALLEGRNENVDVLLQQMDEIRTAVAVNLEEKEHYKRIEPEKFLAHLRLLAQAEAKGAAMREAINNLIGASTVVVPKNEQVLWDQLDASANVEAGRALLARLEKLEKVAEAAKVCRWMIEQALEIGGGVAYKDKLIEADGLPFLEALADLEKTK